MIDRNEQFLQAKSAIKILSNDQTYEHLNISDLKNMKNNDIVLGIKFAPQTSEINCETCAKCKIHVKPFKPSMMREKEILLLIHSNICDPINVESVSGTRYFLTFIDDSRYNAT